LNNGLAAFDRLSSFNRKTNNLVVIAVCTAMLQRVEQCLLNVVYVATPAIGWMHNDINDQWTA
jgi:hypothetical protein